MNQTEQAPPARSAVLNAVVDVVSDGQTVLADESSRRLVYDAYESATSAAERAAVRDAVDDLETVTSGDESTGDQERTLANVADAVLEELSRRDVRATLDHTVPLSFADRDARLVTFAATRDPTVLDELSLSPAVRERVDEGAALAADGAFDEAVGVFEDAAEEAAGGESGVVARILAAWAAHWAGNDEHAIDLVEEVLHLDTSAWSARAVGLAADHRFPEKFRREKLGVRAFLRQTTEIPPRCSVTAAVGVPHDDGVDWTTLSGTDECSPIERLASDMWLRLSLNGQLPAFPTLSGYYVGYGVVDLEVNEARSVEEVFQTGPQATGVTETVSFTR